ncbi:MAG: methyltransferase [Pirellulales bacterium]
MTSLLDQFDLVDETVTAAGVAYQMLHPRSADDLIDEEDFKRDERIPYWAEIWPSARVLAERIGQMRGEGRQFLEMGCAVGMVSTVASRVGFEVLATDYYEEALSFAQINAVRNSAPEPQVRLLDWRRWPQDLPRFDVVAASDVIYEKEYPALVAEAFLRSLAPQGLGLFSDPGRRNLPAFVAECRNRGLKIECVDNVPYDDGNLKPTVQVFEIRR